MLGTLTPAILARLASWSNVSSHIYWWWLVPANVRFANVRFSNRLLDVVLRKPLLLTDFTFQSSPQSIVVARKFLDYLHEIE
jgi:hypothetical protein